MFNRHTTARGTKARIAALVLIIIMLVAGSDMLFAQVEPHTNSLTVVPTYGFRRIDNGSTSRRTADLTGWGPGMEVSYDRFISQEVSVGSSVAAEFYSYEGFKTFDFKVSANLKFRLIPTVVTDSRIKLYFCAGVGADLVVKTDEGLSAFVMLRPGLQLNIAVTEGMDVVAASWGTLNLRDDDMVFHGTIGVGVSFSFGEFAPGKKVTAEDRKAEKAAKAEAKAAEATAAAAEPAAAEPAVEPAPAPAVEPAPAAETTPAAEAAAEAAAAETAKEPAVVVSETKTIAARQYHTEQVSYVSESEVVEKVTTYKVEDVDIEKSAYYIKDTVVTTTVVVWED